MNMVCLDNVAMFCPCIPTPQVSCVALLWLIKSVMKQRHNVNSTVGWDNWSASDKKAKQEVVNLLVLRGNSLRKAHKAAYLWRDHLRNGTRGHYTWDASGYRARLPAIQRAALQAHAQ